MHYKFRASGPRQGDYMKLIYAFLFTLMSSSIFAQVTKTKVLHVTVNISQSYAEVFLVNNAEGDIAHFEWKITHADDENETDTFTVEDVQNGTVFKEGIPKKFVTVMGANFSEVYGGNISIRYPENAITGRYNTEEFEVGRVDNSWPISHNTNSNIKRVHVTVNKVFGIPVGADRVQFLD